MTATPTSPTPSTPSTSTSAVKKTKPPRTTLVLEKPVNVSVMAIRNNGKHPVWHNIRRGVAGEQSRGGWSTSGWAAAPSSENNRDIFSIKRR